ncbi:hypothetical protein JXA85_01605 [Candidatus Woesearchaeota archaeon]|nr:hypothetical protein [Candidatus Woesearchaeota archaeon]
MGETEIGKITHYFSKIGVAVIQLTGNLRVGDKIRVKGATSDFTQSVDSMQVEHEKIEEAKPGDDIGLKVAAHAHEHDKVFKIEE